MHNNKGKEKVKIFAQPETAIHPLSRLCRNGTRSEPKPRL